MRILAINNRFPPDSHRGAEKQVFERLLYLKEKGHSASVITATETGDKFREYHGIVVHYVKNFRSRMDQKKQGILTAMEWFFGDIFDPQVFFRSLKAIRHEDPDVVWVRNIGQLSLSAVLAAKIAGKRIVATPADFWWMCYLNKPAPGCYGLSGKRCATCLCEKGHLKKMPVFVEWMLNQVLFIASKIKAFFFRSMFSHVVFNSRYTREAYLSVMKKIPSNEVIYNPVKIIEPEFSPAALKKKLGLTGCRIILYAGSLTQSKGVDLLIKSFRLVWKKMRNARLVIAGEGSMDEELKRNSEGMKSSIIFCGMIDDPGVLASYYAMCDCLAVPSRDPETFGNVAVEALSQGKPVVVCNTGGALTEIITDNVNGFVTPYDETEFGNAILKALKNSKRFAKTNKNKYDIEYSHEHLSQQYEKMFEMQGNP